MVLLSHSTIYCSSFIKWNLFRWALSLLLLGIEKYHNINFFNKQVLPRQGTITILLLFPYSWVRIAQYYLLLKWKGLTTERRPRLSNGIQKTLNSKMWRAKQNTNLWYSTSLNITRPVFLVWSLLTLAAWLKFIKQMPINTTELWHAPMILVTVSRTSNWSNIRVGWPLVNLLSYNAAFGQIEFTNKLDFDEGDLKLSSICFPSCLSWVPWTWLAFSAEWITSILGDTKVQDLDTLQAFHSSSFSCCQGRDIASANIIYYCNCHSLTPYCPIICLCLSQL